MSAKKRDTKDEGDFIYTPYITLRNGRRLYASECGKRAFKIPVNRERKPTTESSAGKSKRKKA